MDSSPFSKCYLRHFSAIGRERDDSISFKSPVLMISSLNGKLVIAVKDRKIARNKLYRELSQYGSLKCLAFGGVQCPSKPGNVTLSLNFPHPIEQETTKHVKPFRGRNKAPAYLPLCWHPVFTESKRGAVSTSPSGLPHTWGFLMLSEVCCSPRGIF